MNVDWSGLLDPTHALLNSIIRGTIVYLTLFAVLRLAHNRRSGGLNASDVLVITLIGNAVQNSLVGEGRSLTEGAVSSATILFWSFTLDWLAYRFGILRPVLRSKPSHVVKDGRMLRAGMRRELLTEEDLRGQLREQGISDLARVRDAYVEASGNLSFILVEDEPERGSEAIEAQGAAIPPSPGRSTSP